MPGGDLGLTLGEEGKGEEEPKEEEEASSEHGSCPVGESIPAVDQVPYGGERESGASRPHVKVARSREVGVFFRPLGMTH